MDPNYEISKNFARIIIGVCLLILIILLSMNSYKSNHIEYLEFQLEMTDFLLQAQKAETDYFKDRHESVYMVAQ